NGLLVDDGANVPVGSAKYFRAKTDFFLKETLEVSPANELKKFLQLRVGFVVFKMKKVQGDGKGQFHVFMAEIQVLCGKLVVTSDPFSVNRDGLGVVLSLVVLPHQIINF